MSNETEALARGLATSTLHLNNRKAWAAFREKTQHLSNDTRAGISRVAWDIRKQLQIAARNASRRAQQAAFEAEQS
jgi:hypothetical protein